MLKLTRLSSNAVDTYLVLVYNIIVFDGIPQNPN